MTLTPMPWPSPFLFKTHYPENQLVGGGFFAGYAALTVREAWETFGEGNGVGSEAELASAIFRYRKSLADDAIGCVLLRDIFFAPESMTLPGPADFAPNIVRFKGYDISGTGSAFEMQLASLLERSDVRVQDPATGRVDIVDGESLLVPGPVYGAPRLVPQRLGQGSFKAMVLTSYHRRCAITGGRISPTLQAAHIVPVSRGGGAPARQRAAAALRRAHALRRGLPRRQHPARAPGEPSASF